MAYGLPDDLWIFIIIMAIIILALLWKDKQSKGKPKPSKEGPSVSMSLTSGSSKKKGETFKLRGRYSSGDGSISSKTLTRNGKSVSDKISTWSEGTFSTEPITVPDTDNVKCKVGVRTRYESEKDTVAFKPTEGGEKEDPTLNVDVKTTDTEKNDSTGTVEITVTPTVGDAPIKVTVVDAGSIGQEENRGSGNCVFEESGLPAGEYPYRAATKDQSGKSQEVQDTFEIEEEEPPEPGDGTGGDGGFGGGIINNNQNEIINEFNVPPEVVKLLENIVDQTSDKGGGDVTQEVNMEGYQLLLAMHMLQNDLDGGDNQQVINQLQQINNNLQNNQISADELENSLRTVLHQVFDMDLQDMFSDLDVDVSADNFDSDQIVQAINNSSTDIGPIVNRLSNIENAVTQLQNQGNGDLGDIEMKLDQVVNAVNNAGMDQQMMQTFISEIGDLQSKGVEVDIGDVGNKNGADVDNLMMMRLMDDVMHRDNPDREMEKILAEIREQGRLNRELLQQLIEEEKGGGSGSRPNINPANMVKPPGEESSDEELDGVEEMMDNQIQIEIEELETEYKNLQKMVEQTNDVERLEQSLNKDIEEVVKHLKKARQFEHHLKKHQNGQLENSQVKELLEDDIPKIQSEIKMADRAVRQLKKDMRNMREEFSHLTGLEEDFNDLVEKLADQKEALDETEQMLENTENKLMDSGISTID